MFRKKRTLLYLLTLLATVCQAESEINTIKGKVFNADGDIIQFVYIFVNNDSTNSTFTDIDGIFELHDSYDYNRLTFLHPDYKSHIVDIKPQTGDSLKIILKPLNKQQKTWTKNEEHSVFEIIERAVALEHFNDPERAGDSFKYKTYNKTMVDLFKLKDHKIPNKYQNKVENDTLFIKHHHIHGHQHLEIIESVNERIFKYPNKNHERILGLKHTGLENSKVVPLYSNQHPISFYNDYFDFLDTRYATPLGKKTYKHYEFHHEDTWYNNEDTIYVINFRPSHLRVMGLEGTMYINSNNYAIQNIVARPIEYELIGFEIAQKFEFVQDKEWFPHQMNYTYRLHQTPKRYLGTLYDKKTYISDIDFNPKIGKDHGTELCLCESYATKQSEDFWETHRIDPLTRKQKITYLRVDTLRHQSLPSIILRRMYGFYRNRLTYKLPFAEVSNVFQVNRFEGARFGLKASAGKDLLQIVEFNGYRAYGLRDKEWKWGVGVGFFLSKRHDAELKFEHIDDIFEPGTVEFLEKEPDFFRKIFTNRMDQYKSNKVTLSFRTPGYHLVELGFNNYFRRPLYDYQFQVGQNGNDPILSNSYEVSEFSFQTRYAIKEKVTHTLGKISRFKSDYPVFFVNYFKGFSTILDGSFDFHKVVASVDYKFNIGHIGVSKITMEGGQMSSNVPYSFLFNGRGGNLATSSIIIQDHFQTMGIYEFTSNRYLNIFYNHDFGSLIFAHSKFKPDIMIYQHVGWGDLDNKELHSGNDAITNTYSSGFFESGLGVNNFLKFKFYGAVYGALGLGFFYRYGPESNPGGFKENSAYRLTYTLKFL